jgi:DUF4097 and DUF4098 domain-containing protein YvlB
MPASPQSRSGRSSVAAFSLLLLTAAAVSLGACNLHIGTGIEARESWTKTYTVKPGATLSVRESNGKIHVAAADVDKIEVTATRISTAMTEEAAKADLKDFTIAETVTDNLVELDSSKGSLQVVLHGSRRVDYEIKVPKSLNVTIRTANGEINVRDVGGALAIEATNGDIDASGLSGGADVSAVNGDVKLGFSQIAEAGVRCKTTNGEILISIPSASKATIAARILHGEIQTENLPIQKTDESRQRLNATIGGGGPEIRIETTNGEVKVVGK